MVASIKDLENKFILSSSTIMHSQQLFNLPTVLPPMYTGMDILSGKIPDNYNEIQGRTISPQPYSSRASSMSSTKSLVNYHMRIECNNDDIKINNNSKGFELFCKTAQEQTIHISMVADPSNNILNKYVTIKCPTMSLPYVQSVYSILGSLYSDGTAINIQLSYDPNTPIEPELWSGSFHPISLHRSIKHIASDAKNIKDLLNFIAEYITNKQVDSSKVNNLEDFIGISKAVWNFISTVYEANWNVLHMDNNSISLRRKITAKFTPKTQLMIAKNNKAFSKLSLVSIEKIPPPIFTKSQKEVNLISKFLKSNKLVNTNTQPSKSYTQALKQNISMSEVIKIKVFPSIGAKKIDQINNIIKGTPKTRPRI